MLWFFPVSWSWEVPSARVRTSRSLLVTVVTYHTSSHRELPWLPWFAVQCRVMPCRGVHCPALPCIAVQCWLWHCGLYVRSQVWVISRWLVPLTLHSLRADENLASSQDSTHRNSLFRDSTTSMSRNPGVLRPRVRLPAAMSAELHLPVGANLILPDDMNFHHQPQILPQPCLLAFKCLNGQPRITFNAMWFWVNWNRFMV